MDANSTNYTVSDLIAAFGGASAFARVIGKGQSTASEMKRSGRIDVRYWPLIIAAARERGEAFDWITSKALTLMHAPAELPSEVVEAMR